MPIHKLSLQLANQIAAGEVVERPASVVKELVENSIDAGADRITLELTAAGRVGILVRDNGSGIPRAELELALEPHATSKIATLEDLEAVQTMGFRGEALASIAAVSKLTLTSRPADQDKAYMVHTEGPEMTPVVEPAAHPAGTSVEVRELFFNTPARRRFLRSDKAELARIKDIMLRLAMSHPQISFEMLHEGRRLLSAPAVPAGDSAAGFKRLSRLAGTEFAREGLPLEVKSGSFEVSGLILPPAQQAAAVPESIYLYLNNRPVADKMLIHALREAYSEISGGRSSVRAVLFLKCDPREVDVNVHPRKDEVRFHSSRMVHDILVDAVVQRMAAAGELFPLEDSDSDQPPGAGEQGQPAAVPPDAQQIAAFNSRSAGSAGTRPQAAAAAVQALWQTGGSGAAEPAADLAAAAQDFVQQTDPAAIAGALGGTADLLQRSLLPENARAALAVQTVEIAGPDFNAAVLLDLPLPEIALIKLEGRYFLLRCAALQQHLAAGQVLQEVAAGSLRAMRLTLPFILRCEPGLVRALKTCPQETARLGFECKLKRESVEVLQIPAIMKGAELASGLDLVLHLLTSGADAVSQGNCPRQLAAALCAHLGRPRAFGRSEAAALCAKIKDAAELQGLDGCLEIQLGQWAAQLCRL